MSMSLILEVCRNRQVWQQNVFWNFVYKAKKVTKLDNLCIVTKYVCTETLTHSEALWSHAFEFYLQLLSVSEDIQVFYIKRVHSTEVWITTYRLLCVAVGSSVHLYHLLWKPSLFSLSTLTNLGHRSKSCTRTNPNDYLLPQEPVCPPSLLLITS